MAEIKSFPNNQDEYQGAEWLIRWHHGRTSGVFGADKKAAVKAVADTMAVTVSDGLGWLSNSEGNGIVWWVDHEKVNGSPLQLTIPTADSVLGRIDRVVVSWQTTNYVARPNVEILKGTPSTAPVPPALTNNSTLRQISLARINVPAGALAITPDLITDERLDTDVCGIVTEKVAVDTSVMQSQFEAFLNAIEDELNNLNNGVAFEFKRLQFENTTVSAAAFVADTTYEDFPFRASVALEGVLESMTPEVIFGLADAVGGLFAPVTECYTGGVYVYASDVPEADIVIPTIICWKAV